MHSDVFSHRHNRHAHEHDGDNSDAERVISCHGSSSHTNVSPLPLQMGQGEFLTGMFEPGMLNQILIVCAQPREETLFHTNISAHYDNCHVLEYPTVVVYRHSLETVSHR